jgi:NTP pyrophosphatase (non-canonical NTP hydrolase)
MANDYSLGKNHWAGAAKVIEEMGELQQVFGKLITNNGDVRYYDGSNLREKFLEEIPDVLAAIAAFVEYNFDSMEVGEINERAQKKYELFNEWHKQDIA